MSRYKINLKSQAGSRNRGELYKGRPEKTLIVIKKKNGGRNNLGRLTCQTKGGGVKKFYRLVDFKRSFDNNQATIVRLEYDPNRTAFIALIQYENPIATNSKGLSYILATKGMKVGDKVISGDNVEARLGNSLPLENIPEGSLVHSVELKPGKGAVFARSAGKSIIFSGKENGLAILKMGNGETRYVSLQCRATIGEVSNEDHVNDVIGKAGVNRHKGKRPKNRGIARNPVDHPNGGRTKGGKVFTNVTGRVIKGKKTVLRKNICKMIINRRKRN